MTSNCKSLNRVGVSQLAEQVRNKVLLPPSHQNFTNKKKSSFESFESFEGSTLYQNHIHQNQNDGSGECLFLGSQATVILTGWRRRCSLHLSCFVFLHTRGCLVYTTAGNRGLTMPLFFPLTIYWELFPCWILESKTLIY